MATFLDKQGVWMAWDYGNGPEVVNFVSEDPIAVMVFIQNDGMGFPGFWPERMSVPEALSWWRENHINYVPRDKTQVMEDAKTHYQRTMDLINTQWMPHILLDPETKTVSTVGTEVENER